MKENYTELRERQNRELNDFTGRYMFFAFNEEQINQGLAKLGVGREEAHDKIVKTPAGGFILRERADDLADLLNRFDDERREAVAEDPDGSGFIMAMFYDALADHEYIVTMDETEALDSLGYTASEVKADDRLLRGFRLAKRKLERDDTERPTAYTSDDWGLDGSFMADPGQEVTREIYDRMRDTLPPKMIPAETLNRHGLKCTSGFLMGEPNDSRAGANLYLAFGTDGSSYYYLGQSEAGAKVQYIRIEGPEGVDFYEIEAPRSSAIEQAKAEYLESHPDTEESALEVTVNQGDA